MLVEETEDREAEPMLVHVRTTDYLGGAFDSEQMSTRVLGHRVWRCTACKKMACGLATSAPPRVCGFCGAAA